MPIASALRLTLRWFGLALIASISPLVRAQAVSAVADGFDPNVNGNVYAISVQPDGKILVAGSFTGAQPNGSALVSLNNIGRFLPSGRIDSSFSGNVNGQISAMVLQPDGKILIAGKFTSVGGTARNRAARLNADGSLDATFDPNLSGPLTPEASAIALQADGKVLIGGGFTTVQANGSAAVTRNRIARFNANGTLDTAFDPNANSTVLAIAVQPDGKILLGGGFTTLTAAATVRNRIARLGADGSVDTTFDPKANNAVSAIELMPDGRILIGGSFTTLQPNGSDTAASVQNIAALNANGTISSSFSGGTNGPVSVIKLQRDGGVLVGGAFSTLGGGSRFYAGRLLPTGALDYTFFAGPNFNVYAFGLQSDGSIILGGGFTTISGTGRNAAIRNHVARVAASGAFDADFRPDANGRLQSVALQSDGKILIGGSFTSIAGLTRRGAARLNANGSLDSTFNPDLNGIVLAFVQQSDGKIIIGGSFTRVGGLARVNIARLNTDGSVDPGYDPSANNQVTAIALQSDGKAVIGGAFNQLRPNSTTEPVTRASLARINTDGSLDTSFNPNANGSVYSVVVQPDGKILVGGAFTSLTPNLGTSVSRLALARLNSDGTVETSFNPTVDGTVTTVALQSDGKVVFGGSFSRMAPNGSTTVTTRNNIGRVNSDGTLDTAFDPSAGGPVSTLALQSDGHILVGGRFTTFQPNGASTVIIRNYAARLNSNGTVDTGFNLNLDTLPGNQVVAFAQTSDAQLLVGGAFTSLGGGDTPFRSNRLARVNPTTGAADTTFTSDVSTAGGAPIEALVTQADGSILVAGSFSGINGVASANLANFTADGAPNQGFAPTINGPVHAIAQLPAKGAPRATQRNGFAWLQSNGELRSGFAFESTLSLGGIITVAVQADGKILVGGTVDPAGTTGSLARFNANGTRDTSFAPGATGTVSSILVQPDKKIVVGGEFTTVGGVSRINIFRLNEDGSLDTGFNPTTNGSVAGLALQPDNKILVGGNFTSFQPNGATTATGRSYVARLNTDGTVDTAFNPNANSTVRSFLVQPDGKIWILGNFSALQPNGAATSTARVNIARLNADGTVDSIDLKPNGSVNALALQADGKLVIGGSFTNIGGVTRNYLARLNADGTIDPGYYPNPNSQVVTLSLQSDGKIIAGGSFTAVAPGVNDYNPSTATPRNHAVRFNADGTVDASFNPNFDSTVGVVNALADGSVIAVGSFTAIQPSGFLLMGGTFSSINGLTVSNLVLFSNDGSISSTFQPNPNGAVYALAPQADGRAVVGGSFTNIGGTARNHIARFNANDTLDGSFNPAPDRDVFAIVRQSDGKLLVGGAFSSIGGAARANLARLNDDGSNDASFNPSIGGAVHAIAIQGDGRILVTTASDALTNNLVRLDANGSLDGSFSASNNGAVSGISVQADGHVVVGGSFTTIGGGSRSYLARLNANGTLDSTLTVVPNGPVTALSVQADGKVLIGGTFSMVDSLPRFGLARISAPAPASDNFSADASHTVVTWTRSGGAPEISGVTFESSTDGLNWTSVGQGARVAGTSNWSLSGAALAPLAPTYLRTRGISPASPNSSTSTVASQAQFYFGNAVPATPVINSATAVNAAAGSSFLYTITATGLPTSFGATGLPAGLTVNTSTGVISGTPTQQGTFSIVITATNSLGSASTTLTLFVGAPGSISDSGRVSNLSVLAPVTTTGPIIAGFVISGSSPQPILIRAVGPGLTTMNVTGVLAAPKLTIYKGSTVLSDTTSWGGGSAIAAEFTRLGAFPLTSTSADAAVLLTLAPGPYTLHVNDSGTAGGMALAEVYDALTTPPPANSSHLANIAARGVVATAGQTVSGGFVITGATARRMLIRGIGPGLTAQNVTGALTNPIVSLNKIGTGVIAQNDDWGTPTTVNTSYPAATAGEITAAATAAGAFALTAGSADGAILITLSPGLYTAQVSGSGSLTGAAMVEVYEVP